MTKMPLTSFQSGFTNGLTSSGLKAFTKRALGCRESLLSNQLSAMILTYTTNNVRDCIPGGIVRV